MMDRRTFLGTLALLAVAVAQAQWVLAADDLPSVVRPVLSLEPATPPQITW